MWIKQVLAAVVLISLLTACGSGLTLVESGSQVWESETSTAVTVHYSLSDNSLDLVKLTYDGESYTLPRVVSADGARYTKDMDIVWWESGDTAMLQTRNSQGDWETAETFQLQDGVE